MDILIKNIKGLVQVRNDQVVKVSGAEMKVLPVIKNAYLSIKDGKIAGFGEMDELPSTSAVEVIDAANKFVMPGFVDSHTHLVYASSREGEFVDKIKGASYEEIAAKGGGILNSAKKLQQTPEEELLEGALERANEIMQFGTVAVEVKSGYGLTVKDEVKMLRVARKVGEMTPLSVRTTFLGAHAIPREYKQREKYISIVLEEMIPAVAEEDLADYIDVFCEKGFFTAAESELILETGKSYGLIPKVHANQLNISGGVQVGVKAGAISVDHLESVGTEEIALLKNSKTMATLLPGAAFFLGMAFPPARKMLQEGLALALATDYNPGSAPCGKMPLMLSLACIQMKMTPEEAINASTINGAYAMGLEKGYGSITIGKSASVLITKDIPSLAYMPYAFGSDVIDKVILNGKVWEKAGSVI